METATTEFPESELTKNNSSNWLQRLKDESWEAELLVSTVSIFGTFQLFEIINWASNMFIDLLNPKQYLYGYFITYFGLLAISILMSMFVIHFFLRAYWVGLVGLNSVFPDYSIKDSAYSEIYTEKMLNILPKLKDSIQKVDELCSVIFSAAFTLLLMYGYIAIFTSIYLLAFNLLSPYISAYILLAPAAILFLVGMIQSVFVLIANRKSNRHKIKLQNALFKFVQTTSIFTYGPLYKSILQVTMIFGSNFKKKKSIVYLIILFLVSGVFVSAKKLLDTNIPYLIDNKMYFNLSNAYPEFYRSENKKLNFLLAPEIDSDRIETNVLKLFIPIYKHEKNMRTSICEKIEKDPEASDLENRKKRTAQQVACYELYNFAYLNGEKISLDFLPYYHSITNQFGVISYIDLSGLNTGMQKLEIKKEFSEDNVQEWAIPFYYNTN